MKVLVIYDTTGKIWSVTYGITETPQGFSVCLLTYQTEECWSVLMSTDSKNPKPVFSSSRV